MWSYDAFGITPLAHGMRPLPAEAVSQFFTGRLKRQHQCAAWPGTARAAPEPPLSGNLLLAPERFRALIDLTIVCQKHLLSRLWYRHRYQGEDAKGHDAGDWLGAGKAAESQYQ